MKKLMKLLDKMFLTLEELKIVEENQEVEFIEYFGMSKGKDGYHWYNVTLKNKEEYSIYTSSIYIIT